ncbi:TPA: hypothetical protein U9I93_003202 [Acinetobacter baumannii]|nr:hypothetical protein [Acinetobacter baumannii]ENW32509.1 hypothetical protein F922_03818 [Acinetobacter baumannii NIPH 201]BBT51010.1 hypothetical protein WP8W18E11_P11050 [Acinetobacter baumannii]HDX6153455.1 hypothetical protein [Acinetobacter baumannii]HEN9536854.1 hypothetical protein [Acinetobacter baumannii]
MAEILITRIPNSRDADKVGIELESILDALAAKFYRTIHCNSRDNQ